MHVLDLFSGIGGFSIGLERAGFKTVAFCEIDPYCRAVLKKHWPGVVCFSDVRLLNRDMLDLFGITVDVICGGFPCQDISLAGKGAGLKGARSGLWSEFHRLIKEIRPRYAIIENVSALRSRGLDQILRQLAEIGYDAEWHCIPASAVGAPHRRDRVWIVAYAERAERRQECRACDGLARTDDGLSQRQEGAGRTRSGSETVADSHFPRSSQRCESQLLVQLPPAERSSETVADARWDSAERHEQRLREIGKRDWWLVEPDVGRVANGIANRVDRLRALGNAVVPQIPEIIGRAILVAEKTV